LLAISTPLTIAPSTSTAVPTAMPAVPSGKAVAALVVTDSPLTLNEVMSVNALTVPRTCASSWSSTLRTPLRMVTACHTPPTADFRAAVNGAFKVPGLRNVELTGPYMHNGGMATLEQVVEFYNRGGNFPVTNRQTLDVDIAPIGLSAVQRADLVAFLKSLTDDRVRYDKAPFDHPSLSIPNGGQGDDAAVVATDPLGLFSAGTLVSDNRIELPAAGKNGNGVSLGTPHTPFANFLDPLQ